MATMQKITSNLWFSNQAEEAAKYYTSIFDNSKIDKITRYSKAGQEIHGMAPGTIMTVAFTLEGQSFVALNGGPIFKFNEAVSFIVNCENQEEIDYYWNKLAEGGDKDAQQCGWLKDRFGLSWQVVPTELADMYKDAESEKAQRTMKAMLKMKKLDIAALRAAYNGQIAEKAV